MLQLQCTQLMHRPFTANTLHSSLAGNICCQDVLPDAVSRLPVARHLFTKGLGLHACSGALHSKLLFCAQIIKKGQQSTCRACFAAALLSSLCHSRASGFCPPYVLGSLLHCKLCFHRAVTSHKVQESKRACRCLWCCGARCLCSVVLPALCCQPVFVCCLVKAQDVAPACCCLWLIALRCSCYVNLC